MTSATSPASGLPGTLSTEQVIDLIFKDPAVKHGLTEFIDLGKKPHEILSIYPKPVSAGRSKGEVRYYLKCLKRNIDIQVYSAKASNPEELVRQLWLYKLHRLYKYPWDHVAVEHAVHFGTITADKLADIIVFQKDAKTAKLVIEVKRPERKDGLSQLKSYLNAEGSPVGIWSNGHERIILYRPYPHEFDDTLTEIPSFAEKPEDLLKARVTLEQLKREFDFKRIIQTLEELVLASYGGSEFDEIFKLIFAKLYDEQAAKDRAHHEVKFRKSTDPEVTHETITRLLERAIDEWPGIFDEHEKLKLTPQHLQVCVGPLERIRLLGANMRIMDDAFEYLMPQEMKKKQGQFFTPRHVIDMCVKMLNPNAHESVIDPACGSAGFLIHVLDYVTPADTDSKKQNRKFSYASKYLWGCDFGEKPSKVARALMLVAGDGRSHIYRVNSLDPREWFANPEGEALRTALREANLLTKKPPSHKALKEGDAWEYFRSMKFDVLLTNPPFAGEIRDVGLLKRYELAGPALNRKGKKGPKEERDVLFIERCLDLLKPGGRMAIVLPQGKLNNLSLGFIRKWLLRRVRILAAVGLHANTFRPHTGTKTSVLVLQSYTSSELSKIASLEEEIAKSAPNFGETVRTILEAAQVKEAISATDLPDDIAEMIYELYEAQSEGPEEPSDSDAKDDGERGDQDVDMLAEQIDQKTADLARISEEMSEAIEQRKSLGDQGRGSEKSKQAIRDLLTGLRDLRTLQRTATKELEILETRLGLLSVKGKLRLLLANQAALVELRQRWVDAEIANRINYPVFMATSLRGGKDSSGEYEYREDSFGTFQTDAHGDPLIDQDCVSYRPDDPSGIAEAFIEWARTHGVEFWRESE